MKSVGVGAAGGIAYPDANDLVGQRSSWDYAHF